MTADQQPVQVREGLKVRFKPGGDTVWTVGLVANGHVWIAEWTGKDKSATTPIDRFWESWELVEDPTEDESPTDRLIEESLALEGQWESVSRFFGDSQFDEDDALAELHAVGHMAVWNAKKLAEALGELRADHDVVVARHRRTVLLNNDLVNQKEDLAIERIDRENLLVKLEDAIDNIDQPGLDATEWIAKAKTLARELSGLNQEKS